MALWGRLTVGVSSDGDKMKAVVRFRSATQRWIPTRLFISGVDDTAVCWIPVLRIPGGNVVPVSGAGVRLTVARRNGGHRFDPPLWELYTDPRCSYQVGRIYLVTESE
jgi:hypothetical protein